MMLKREKREEENVGSLEIESSIKPFELNSKVSKK